MEQIPMAQLESIKKIIVPILKDNGAEFIGIFGSYARGENKSESDLDVLVKFSKPKGLFDIIGLERELSEKLERRVDLVTQGALSPYIKDNVFKDLKIIYQ